MIGPLLLLLHHLLPFPRRLQRCFCGLIEIIFCPEGGLYSDYTPYIVFYSLSIFAPNRQTLVVSLW